LEYRCKQNAGRAGNAQIARERDDRSRRSMNRDDVIKVIILLLLIITGAFLFFYYDLYTFFISRKKILVFVNSFGPLSVIIFIGLQILQVIVAPIPGEVNGFIGGYLYGPLFGTLYSTIGLTLGSWLAFALARWLGLPFVEKVISPRIIEKYDYFMEHRGILITFILFVIPGFPKDALSYLIGLSHMKTSTFLIICTAGRLMGTIMLSMSGHYARNDQNIVMAAILGISALIVILAYFYHDEILRLVSKKRDTKEGR
jgi:uncharacterized membrane protein YdjX (TVP38/TMEM64 family)